MHLTPGAPPPREAFAVVFQKSANRTFEAVADLTARRLVSWTEIPGVQPAILGADALIAEQVVRADPRWREAMRKRGINDLRNVQVALWTPGYFGLPEEQGVRMGKALSYYRGQAENFYARPIEGVIAWVNLNRGTVIKLEDTGIVAMTDVTVARMSAAVFRAAVHAHPDICDQVLALLAGQIRMLANRVNEFSTLDVRHRIHAELLRLSRTEAGDPARAVISPPPVHAEIAARISTRREAVARELKALERDKLIERRRGALVLTDVDKLRRMINEAIDAFQSNAPFGAKGVGESATMPLSPAIANAIDDAVGVRLTELPLTPEAVFRALREKEGKPLEEG